jgi:hypothetical protein
MRIIDFEQLLEPAVKEFTTRVASIVQTATVAHVRSVLDVQFAGAPAARGTRRPISPATSRGGRPRGPRRSSTKLAAARRVQGEYLGLLRTLKGTARAQVKRVAARDGVAAAVAVAKKAAVGSGKRRSSRRAVSGRGD